MKSFLAAILFLSGVQLTAQTACDSLAPVPKLFDMNELTDSTRFMPDFIHGIPDSYSFEIRDRWGELVFSTDIPEQGWNGLRNNRKDIIVEGTYMWTMTCAWNYDSVAVNCKGFVKCTNTAGAGKIIALDTIKCRPTLYVPNSFTPNGDGPNDVFIPFFGCPPVEYEMQIFDRWGNLVFQTTDVNKGWDGNESSGNTAQIDTYVWKIKCKFYEGDKKRQYGGHVALIR